MFFFGKLFLTYTCSRMSRYNFNKKRRYTDRSECLWYSVIRLTKLRHKYYLGLLALFPRISEPNASRAHWNKFLCVGLNYYFVQQGKKYSISIDSFESLEISRYHSSVEKEFFTPFTWLQRLGTTTSMDMRILKIIFKKNII